MKLPCWERLHGFWRTLPSFNPYSVSSEPGQDLVREAEQLMQRDSKGSEEDSNKDGNTEIYVDDFEELEVGCDVPKDAEIIKVCY